MKKIIYLLVFLLIGISSFAQSKSSSDVYVKGYTRSDGVYVKPHYRSAPNGTNRDNFSTKGNVNPYTGKKGYVEPDKKTYNYTNSSRNTNSASNSSPFSYKTMPKSSHILFGIDLNKDWYTLTDISALSYFTEQEYRKKNNIPGVAMTFSKDYLKKNANFDFLNIGFTDLTGIYPKNEGGNLKNISPYIFIATLKYNSDNEYEEKSSDAFNKITYLLMNQFGAPDNSTKAKWGASLEWKFSNAELLLNSNKKQHITVMYIKN